MTDKTKKIILWAVIAAIVIALALYLLLAKPGNALMASLAAAAGLAAGWAARMLYEKIRK